MGLLLYILSGYIGAALLLKHWAIQEGDIEIDVEDIIAGIIICTIGGAFIFAGGVYVWVKLAWNHFVYKFPKIVRPDWFDNHVFTVKGVDKS